MCNFLLNGWEGVPETQLFVYEDKRYRKWVDGLSTKLLRHAHTHTLAKKEAETCITNDIIGGGKKHAGIFCLCPEQNDADVKIKALLAHPNL